MNKPIYQCLKCGWEGKRPASMSAGPIKVKICQECLGQVTVKEEAHA